MIADVFLKDEETFVIVLSDIRHQENCKLGDLSEQILNLDIGLTLQTHKPDTKPFIQKVFAVKWKF